MKIIQVIILNFLLLTGASAYAAPGGGPPQPMPGGPPSLPVDGGGVLLLVAALCYGMYKINQFKFNKKTPI
jgi:hypothetical protein